MSQLAAQLAADHAQAAAAQSHIRNGRRVIRRDLTPSIAKSGTSDSIDGMQDSTEIVVVPAAAESSAISASAHTLITSSPLDLPTEQFRSGLDRRKQNRQLLMEWIRTALIDGVDFGRVHIASKERCEFARSGRVRECNNPYHWSKPSLFKPGAEKITGMLGMTVHYPSLAALEHAVLAGTQIGQIMLRCELHDAHGRVVAEGVGARSLTQDYGDINKSLKMAEKSAHIDATLRLAGLSEVFTQDLEDRPAGAEIDAEPPHGAMPNAAKKSAKTSTSANAAATDNNFSKPTITSSGERASPPSAPPPAPSDDAEIITDDDVQIVRNRIAEVAITEKRVLAWLYKVTKGTVTRFDQLNVAQCTSLLKRLEIWAQEMASQPTH